MTGCRSLRPSAAPTAGHAGRPGGTRLNPKLALFFLAFLPQFSDPLRGHLFVQFLILGTTMAVLDTAYELALVLAFSRLRARYAGGGRLAKWQAKVTGLVLVALGLRLAAQAD